MKLNIVSEFTDTPGGRYIAQGPYSGEEFRDTILKVKYDYCLLKNEKLVINFDGGYGYPISFIDEAFGGMVRDGYSAKKMLKNMVFISNDCPSLSEKIVECIKEHDEIKRQSKRKVKIKKK